MQFDMHLVIVASGHLALEIEPFCKLSGKSYLAFFPLILECQLLLTTTMQIDLDTDYPTSVSPAVNSSVVGRVNLLILVSKKLFGITYIINGLSNGLPK